MCRARCGRVGGMYETRFRERVSCVRLAEREQHALRPYTRLALLSLGGGKGWLDPPSLVNALAHSWPCLLRAGWETSLSNIG